MQSRAASRYAKSIVSLAVERGELEKVFADMKLVKTVLEDSRDLRVLMSSPIVRSDKKISILKSIFESSVTELTMTFIDILATKRREAILGDVADSYIDKYYEHKNVMRTLIKSVDGVGDKLKDKVKELVQSTIQNEIEIIEEFDKELIGGFVLRVGDQQVDASIKRKLEKLKRNFSDNPYIADF